MHASEPLRLAIIGGGPSATYALERLAATATRVTEPFSFEVHVIDRTGEFGAGEVHSPTQPTTSFLNRIVGQVAFAADETVEDAGPLLAQPLRPTLQEWCRRRYAETGDADFDLAAEDWPQRYVHGLALRDCFDTYVGVLRAHPSVTVRLHHDEVADLVEVADGFDVVSVSGARLVRAHQVLCVTGHSRHDPDRVPRARELSGFAREHGARYISSAYPLEEHLSPDRVGPDDVVACAGMGLTAIDVILYLTEGRGGTFEPGPGGRLVYHESGEEPASIVVFADSGLFTFARPFNAKEADLQRFEHQGVFLVEEAVDDLRKRVGATTRLEGTGPRRQLDFERHLLPIVLLEMAHLYYRTLLGETCGRLLRDRAEPGYRAFLEGAAAEPVADAPWQLTVPVDAGVAEIAEILDGVLEGATPLPLAREAAEAVGWDLDEALARYLHVVLGPAQVPDALAMADRGLPVAGLASPARHHRLLRENLFDWQRTVRPIDDGDCWSAEGYRKALLDFIDRDHRWAAQNNLDNPAKAAADGVWRDLRPVLAHAVDFGGLTASSHRTFLNVYMRHHNRLANGAALEVMEKIRALLEHGLVDASAGPGGHVVGDPGGGRFRVEGPRTGHSVLADVLVQASVHPFDPERDVAPLYRNMLRRGLVRQWRNTSADGSAFAPGGLDLTEGFHPRRADGSPDTRLTFLGPPSEGVMFFQLGALRPCQNHHVMQDMLQWLRAFWTAVADRFDIGETAELGLPVREGSVA